LEAQGELFLEEELLVAPKCNEWPFGNTVRPTTNFFRGESTDAVVEDVVKVELTSDDMLLVPFAVASSVRFRSNRLGAQAVSAVLRTSPSDSP
jgi:hypothetical protein